MFDFLRSPVDVLCNIFMGRYDYEEDHISTTLAVASVCGFFSGICVVTGVVAQEVGLAVGGGVAFVISAGVCAFTHNQSRYKQFEETISPPEDPDDDPTPGASYRDNVVQFKTPPDGNLLVRFPLLSPYSAQPRFSGAVQRSHFQV